HADRRKVLARIVADILVERWTDSERAGVAEDQRVAVGIAFRDRACADRAAGTGTVVNDDLFAEQFTHLLRDTAADNRGAAAGRERDHARTRRGRIVLRLHGSRERGERRERGKKSFAD